MALYDILSKALEEKDAGMYTDLFHEDYEFVRHQTGTSMHREQVVEMMKMMMANEKVVIRDARCVYENDEVLVEHSVMDFPDGTTEAVMAVHILQDGKIIRTETGATSFQSEKPNKHSIQGPPDQFCDLQSLWLLLQHGCIPIHGVRDRPTVRVQSMWHDILISRGSSKLSKP